MKVPGNCDENLFTFDVRFIYTSITGKLRSFTKFMRCNLLLPTTTRAAFVVLILITASFLRSPRKATPNFKIYVPLTETVSFKSSFNSSLNCRYFIASIKK